MRYLVVVVLLVSLLVLQSDAFKASVQWGQNTIRQPGAWVNMASSSSTPYDEPALMYTKALGNEQVEQISTNSDGVVLVRSSANNYYVSGAKQTSYSTLPRPPYWPAKLNFTGTPLDSSNYEIVSLALCDVSILSYLEIIQALIKNVSDPSGATFYVPLPTSEDDWYEFGNNPIFIGNNTLPVSNFECSKTICYLIYNGIPYFWGNDQAYFMFGPDNDDIQIPSPTPIKWDAAPPTWSTSEVHAGRYHVVAINGLDRKQIVSWGNNNDHCQLGTCSVGITKNIADFPYEINQLAVGFAHNLLLLMNGSVMAYGASHLGQLGHSDPSPIATPSLVSGFPGGTTIKSVQAQGHTSFAVTNTGMLFIWGSNIGAEDFSTTSLAGYSPGPVGMFGYPFSTEIYTHIPFSRNPLVGSSFPSGSTVESVARGGVSCQTQNSLQARCNVFLIVNLPSAPSFDIPIVHPSLITPSLGSDVVISWGSPIVNGNSRMPPYSPVLIPQPSFVELPQGKSFDRLWTDYKAFYLRDQSDNSTYAWGDLNGNAPHFDRSKYWPQYAFKPMHSNQGNAGNPGIIHFAATESASAVMYEDDPNVYFLVDPLTNLNVKQVYLGNPETIRSISGGHNHFVVLFNNGSLYTHAADEIYNYALGFPGPAFRGLVDVDNVLMVSAGYINTAIYFFNTTASANRLEIATFGQDGLGRPGSYSSTPSNVDMSAVPIWSSIQQLVSGVRFTLALLNTGDVIGWGDSGNLPIFPLGSQYDRANLVLSQAFFDDGVYIAQISTQAYIAMILTSEGKLYIWGNAPTGDDTPPSNYVFLTLARKSYELVHIDLSTVLGLNIQIKRLPEPSAAVGNSERAIPVVVIGHVISSSTPTSSPSTSPYRVMSWGDNYPSSDYVTPSRGPQTLNLGAETPFPFVLKPRPMFESMGPHENVFPFDVATATYAFSKETSWALTSTQQLFAWGNLPRRFSGGDVDIQSSARFSTPVLVASNVIHMAAMYDGIVVILANGSLGCTETTWSSEGLCGYRFSSSPSYNDPSAIFKIINPPAIAITSFACASRYCVGLTAMTTTQPMYYWGVDGATNFGDGGEELDYAFVSNVLATGDPNTNTLDSIVVHFNMSDNGGSQNSFVFKMADRNSRVTPLDLGLSAHNVTRWIAGSQHVLVLKDNGELYGWGSNYYHQLSSSSSTSWFIIATRIFEPFFITNPIKDIGAFNLASMALIEGSGDLYAWGSYGIPLEEVFVASIDQYHYVTSRKEPTLVASNPLFLRLLSSSATGNYDSYSFVETSFQAFMIGAVPPEPEHPPSGPSCQGTAPVSIAVCLFIDGTWKWTIVGNYEPSSNEPMDIQSDIVIIGNWTINDANAVVFRAKQDGKLPLVNVTECAFLNQPLNVELKDEDLKRMAKAKTPEKQKLVECAGPPLTGDLNRLVNTKTAGKSCRKAQTTTTEEVNTQGRTTLNTLFKVNSAKCNNWWIILVSVLGGVILLISIFGIIYAASPKMRSAIRPYKGTN
jgi:alpha-tubulin suppressor-like RCC1 family protein